MLDTDQAIDDLVEAAKSLSDAGFDTLWCSQIFAYDALTLLAVIGRELPRGRTRLVRRPGVSQAPGRAGGTGPDRAVCDP